MTDQSEFWSGEFGDQYIERNSSEELLSSNLSFFSSVLNGMGVKPETVFEFGANVGMNLDAIKLLAPRAKTCGLDVNSVASEKARAKGHDVECVSLEEFQISRKFDLTISKGVLIHLAPKSLPLAYKLLAECSNRFVLIAEYFSPEPTRLNYRGHSNRLFKRDFAGEFLRMNDGFEVRRSGFLSSLGVFPQDDINWYLLERS